MKIIVVGTRDALREASLYVVGLVNQCTTLLACLLPPSSRLPSWQLLKLILTNNCRNRTRNVYRGGGTASSPSAAATTILLTMNHTTSLPLREPSPASGSPLRYDAGLTEYEYECEAVNRHRLEDITLERAEERRTDDCKTLRMHLGPAPACLSLIPTSSVFCLPVYLHSISLLTRPQNKTNNDRRQIRIRISRRPCSHTVRLARHCRHTVRHQHHRTSPHQAT